MSENAQTNQRMLLAIVTGPDSENVENALAKAAFPFAKLPSVGGLLRERNVTFLIGCPGEETDHLRQMLQEVAGRRIGYVSPVLDNLPMGSLIPTEVQIGGVTIFDLDIEHYEEIG
ncbi:MAG TPA: cyclic-di-AMP receptor [Anaerolineaceae bacterium]|nr:cyclic-di-AMP receptor [Anaerolineaceae bacterium]